MAANSRTRLAEIKELAEDVSETYWTDAIANPKRALGAGARVCLGDFGDAFDGLLEWRDGAFFVYCNTRARLPERMRFTLAHEAGHLYIDDHRNALITGEMPGHPSLSGFASRNPIEREADAFAAHFLMPRSRLVESAKRLPKGLAAVSCLACEFGTSITATALRYLDDVLGEGAVLFWGVEGKNWRRVSDEWWSIFHRGIEMNVAALGEGSATLSALTAEPTSTQLFHGISAARSWFPHLDAGSERDVVLHEEAMRLGPHGVITLLYSA